MKFCEDVKYLYIKWKEYVDVLIGKEGGIWGWRVYWESIFVVLGLEGFFVVILREEFIMYFKREVMLWVLLYILYSRGNWNVFIG